jgi:hypothetical protein
MNRSMEDSVIPFTEPNMFRGFLELRRAAFAAEIDAFALIVEDEGACFHFEGVQAWPCLSFLSMQKK